MREVAVQIAMSAGEPTGKLDRSPAVDAMPFGHFAPTPMQCLLIALASHTPLGRGRARWQVSKALEAIRPGPIDAERLGVKMRLHHYGTYYSEKKMLLHFDSYDPEERAQITRHLRSGFSFADIGANAGFYSLLVKALCPDARIIAFEPNADYFEHLSFNVRANQFKDFSVLRAAVGGEEGTTRFYIDADSLIGKGRFTEVRVVPLHGALLNAGFRRLDGMKIDIEGYEDRVLFPFFESAPREFWPRVIVIEHSQHGFWKRDCMVLCASLGYKEKWRGKGNAVLELEPGVLN